MACAVERAVCVVASKGQDCLAGLVDENASDRCFSIGKGSVRHKRGHGHVLEVACEVHKKEWDRKERETKKKKGNPGLDELRSRRTEPRCLGHLECCDIARAQNVSTLDPHKPDALSQ